MRYIGLISKVGTEERCCEAIGISKDIYLVAEKLYDKLVEFCDGCVDQESFTNTVITKKNNRFNAVSVDSGKYIYSFKIQEIRRIDDE